MDDRPAPADGGCVGGGKGRWTAVLALWVRSFVFHGLLTCLGLMLPTLQEQFQTQAWVLGGITAQVNVFAGLSGNYSLCSNLTSPMTESNGYHNAVAFDEMVVAL